MRGRDWTIEDFTQNVIPLGALGLCLQDWFNDFTKSDMYLCRDKNSI